LLATGDYGPLRQTQNGDPLQRPAAAAERSDPANAVRLRRVLVSGFRNIKQVDLRSDARMVVLTGPNGAGKTNLLEALSFLSPGRGLRRARLSELESVGPAAANAASSFGPGGWAVSAEAVTPEGVREIGTGRDPALSGANDAADGEGEQGAGRERRIIRVDGATQRSQQAFSEVLSVVWLTPQMDGLFRDSSSGRRRFLDRLVLGFDPGHSARLAAYEQCLRQRSRLLKDGVNDTAWLAALEDKLVNSGTAIAAARKQMVLQLDHAAGSGIGPFPSAGIGMECQISAWLDEMPAVEAEERFRWALADQRARDRDNGGAGTGPHRADLNVLHLKNGQAAALCSTGEQKALLISILLAHARLLTAERGTVPLLLLDEVAAHLDEERRDALFKELLALGAQTWMTGTDAEVFESLGAEADHFAVADGEVSPKARPIG